MQPPNPHGRADRRTEQIVRNEALFREVNERVRDVSAGRATPTTEFLCECGDSECAERIALHDEEYEGVRSDPLLFAVVPGHEIPDVEDVVAADERYLVVRKREGEGAIARLTDPRG
ncbi:MAG TPA: hypothetical protein VD704_09475 [Gaiellaceae bacterium]|nr:hypothetical protein [Gaiellaceae bacterium]